MGLSVLWNGWDNSHIEKITSFMLEKVFRKDLYHKSNYIILALSGQEVEFYGEEGEEAKRKARA